MGSIKSWSNNLVIIKKLFSNYLLIICFYPADFIASIDQFDLVKKRFIVQNDRVFACSMKIATWVTLI